MDKKILIIIILAIIVVGLIVACATVMLPKNTSNVNNATNITNNTTNNTVNVTHIGNNTESNSHSDSKNNNNNQNSASKVESDPAFGSDEYVAKWDESQRNGDSWAYTHNQPTKSENGQSYHRMYNPDTGESYWAKGI